MAIFIEVIHAAGMPFIAVSFVRGRGMRMPDNGYRYREGVPMQEYFQNWGQVLGQMHRLAKTYQPLSKAIRRPEWHTCGYFHRIPVRRTPARYPDEVRSSHR